MLMENEKKSSAQQERIQTPKGTGLSPKLVIAIGLLSMAAFGLVTMAVFEYQGDAKHQQKTTHPDTLVRQQSGVSPEDEINKINQNQQNGKLNTTGSTVATSASTNGENGEGAENQSQSVNAETSAAVTAQQKKEAAASPISVVNNFQGPVAVASSTSNGQSGEASSASTAPEMAGFHEQAGYQQANMQGEKTAFLQSMKKKDDAFYLNSTLEKPLSPYEVKAGTIIPATLLTGIDSDLPGEIIAQVSQNVYDTVSGNYLLIPQGTKVIGKYDSQIAYGQSRVLIAWSRLIYPNGDSFDLEGMPGADLYGMSGLHDKVDNHYFRIFGSALMFSMFGALGQLSQPQQSATGLLTNQQIIAGAIGQQLTDTGAKLVEKNLNIQPTIKIRPGTNFNILLSRDMVLPAPYAR